MKALGFWISNIGFRVIVNHKNIKQVSVRAHTCHFEEFTTRNLKDLSSLTAVRDDNCQPATNMSP